MGHVFLQKILTWPLLEATYFWKYFLVKAEGRLGQVAKRLASITFHQLSVAGLKVA